MRESIVIDPGFAGPPDVGNGGYVCGLLAMHIEGPAEATLRMPAPLGRELIVERELEPKQSARLIDGGTLIAEAHSIALHSEPPAFVPLQEAEACVPRYTGFKVHRYPSCFVCGPERKPGEGFRIFAGPTEDGRRVAAPFRPETKWGDAAGLLSIPLLWAALDCPGYFAAASGTLAVLGRMSCEVLQRPKAGEDYVVVGQATSQKGRKYEASTALYDVAGTLYGHANQTWIALR